MLSGAAESQIRGLGHPWKGVYDRGGPYSHGIVF